MMEEKEDVGEAMAFKQKGKPQIKFQVRPTTMAKVMAWPLHKIKFLNWKN